MPTTELIESFSEFAKAKVDQAGNDLSIDDLYDGLEKGTSPFTRCEGGLADELWTPVRGLSRFASSTLAIRRAGLGLR